MVINPDGSKSKMKERPSVKEVYGLLAGEKVHVPYDEKDKAPYTKAQSLLSSFLSQLVKKCIYAPLSILTWDNPAFDEYKKLMIRHVESKFSYPIEMRIWVLEKLNKAWRSYKSELKKHFEKFDTLTEARNNVPKDVNQEQWNVLISDWSSNEKKKQCEINKQNALKNKFPHTLGRKSFARKRKEMEGENGKAPDRLEFFEVSHKRKNGSFVNEASMEKWRRQNN